MYRGIFRHLRTSEGGLSAAVGTSVLEGIATIGETSTSLDAGEAPLAIFSGKLDEVYPILRQVKSVSAQMVSLISNLGAATVISLQTGATQDI